jgi:coenzyme F420-0:L-glutamate ligase / coenzyme F420-1:gamma-L-glutamate ligase
MEADDQARPILDVIATRRSIRRYREEPVPAALLELVLQAATWAPSAHNRQPWRFAVVQGLAARSRLAEAMGARLRADLEADGVAGAVIAADLARSYRRLAGAPVLIVVCLTMADMDRYPDERRQNNERIMAIQSTAMAGQNLLLAAHALGLAGCWMCAPLFSQETVCAVLELPAGWEPQGLVTLGYPAQERIKERKPLPEVLHFAG